MKKRRILAIIIAAMMAAASLTACGNIPESSEVQSGSSGQSAAQGGSADEDTQNITAENLTADTADTAAVIDLGDQFTSRDLSGDYDESGAVSVTMDKTSFKVSGDGASADGSTLTITKAGVYIISGTIENGSIVVDAGDTDKVQLVLDNANITCADYSAIFINNADKVFITLKKGTKNTISDGKTYRDEAQESGADSAIYSKDDLVINGSGELTVSGNYSHAIVSKDDLKITGGTITASSVGGAIVGKDSVRIASAEITVTSGGDGIKASSTEDPSRGYVYLESGSVNITAENDAVQAETALYIRDARLTAKSGGGAAASTKTHTDEFGGRGMFGMNAQTAQTTDSDSDTSEDSDSFKGLKAGGDITVDGSAEISIDSADDSVHADGGVYINSGTLTLAAGDDGIHAEQNVVIGGGDVTISQSYEGIEGMSITIGGGNVSVTASDDGLNATDGSASEMDGFGGMGGMGMMPGDTTSEDVFVLISGGKLHVDAGGDGLDSNGKLLVTGGTTYVDGPTNSGNGAIDTGNGASISGGTVIAIGSSGMAETFASDSAQCSILYNMSESHSKGEKITLSDQNGKVIAEYTAAKTFNSVVISTPDIKESGTYTLTAGSSSYEITVNGTSYSNGGSMGFGGMKGENADGTQGFGMQGGMGGQMPGGEQNFGMRGGMGGHGMRGSTNGSDQAQTQSTI